LPRDESGAVLGLAATAPAGQVVATVPVSAKTGEGLPELLQIIETALAQQSLRYRVHISHTEGAEVGWLYNHAEIISRGEPNEDGLDYVVRVERRHLSALLERFSGRVTAEI
jgi:GTP-binding protein HflX